MDGRLCAVFCRRALVEDWRRRVPCWISSSRRFSPSRPRAGYFRESLGSRVVYRVHIKTKPPRKDASCYSRPPESFGGSPFPLLGDFIQDRDESRWRAEKCLKGIGYANIYKTVYGILSRIAEENLRLSKIVVIRSSIGCRRRFACSASCLLTILRVYLSIETYVGSA